MAALAILAVAVFILLDAHYSALQLHQTMEEEVSMRQLLESAVSRADLEVRAGNLEDSGDFGKRYPGYTWTFLAEPAGSDEVILLYKVSATVHTPDEERKLDFFVYDTGVESLNDTGSTTSKSVFDE